MATPKTLWRNTWRVTICACPDPPNFFVVVDGGVPQKRCEQQKRFFFFEIDTPEVATG